MARFLIAVWPFPGHVFPLLAVAQALREREHEVAFYTGAQAWSLVEDQGFVWFPFKALDEEKLDAMMQARGAYASGRHPLRLKALLNEWLLGTLPDQLADLSPLLASWEPDVIITETSMWAPILVLHETQTIPIAVFSTVAGCMLPGPDAAPFGPGLPRPSNYRTRLIARVARRIGDWLASDVRQAANRIRADHSLPALDISVTEFAGQLPLYLMPSLPEFDYQRQDLPASVQYIGPCLWDKPQREPSPAWLTRLSGDQPVVHVTEGTVHTQTPMVLRAAAEGLAGRPMQVIMTTGASRDPEHLDLGPLAPNIRLTRWVAHSDLLPLTDVLVTTGGAGTVMAALHAGVPLVVVPTEWDKPENAQRVVEAGVGVRLAPQRCTPTRLRAAVEQVLSDPGFRRNAQRMSTLLTRYDGPTRAAQLLEELCISKPVRRYASMT